MSVRLSTCNTVAVIGLLSVGFDIGNLHENVSRKSGFGFKKVLGTFQEDPVYVLLLPQTLTDERQEHRVRMRILALPMSYQWTLSRMRGDYTVERNSVGAS